MKRVFVIFCLLMGLISVMQAQAPAAFKYQALLRKASGAIIPDTTVALRISLLQGGASGTVIYAETHTVKSNSQGIVNLNVGKGTLASGSFASVNWAAGNIYLKIEMDMAGGTNFQSMGGGDLLSVPFALYAQTGIPGPAGPQGPTGATGTTSWKDGAGNVTTNVNVGINTPSPGGKLIVTADSNVPADSALFEVRNKKGETIFAVYESGVRVYIPESTGKGAKGGFAVGGRGPSKGTIHDILQVYPDSVRIIINESVAKGAKGGFAVGGRDASKGIGTINDMLTVNHDSVRIYIGDSLGTTGRGGFAIGSRNPTQHFYNNLLTVSPDSVRVYINNTLGKGAKGGFAVGGRDPSSKGKGASDLFLVDPNKTEVHGGSDAFSVFSNLDTALSVQQSQIGAASYLRISPTNFFIGQESGLLSTGLYNSFIGYRSGKANITGAYNVFLGYQTGLQNNDGSYNVFMGWEAGLKNISSFYNTYIGTHAGFQNPYGLYNTAVGSNSGANVEYGKSNTFLGLNTGLNLENGSYNTFLGSNAGYGGSYNPASGETSNNNTFIGYESGHSISTGFGNTILGDSSGFNLANGSYNVFLGHGAGKNETNSNRLYIANSSTSKPLLFGEFDSSRLVINGVKADNVSKATFFVNGTAGGTNAWSSVSDARLKKNIVPIPNAIDKVMQLQGVNFEWIDASNKTPGKHMGFVAQEAQKVVPEVVNTSGNYLSMEYAPITALLVEALKEQQKMIEELKAEVEKLKQQQQKK
jgi:hypothetical protein